MRTIKFRGKRVSSGEWLYGDLVHDNIGGCYIYPIESENLYKENAVLPDTVGQYTGLKDKAGKEIYEGDALRFEDGSTRVVIWNDRECGFNIVAYGIHLCKVVGNIYDPYMEPADTEHTYELCPHCEEEVELKAELSVQKCLSCGKHIVCCSMCEECLPDCPFEEEANRLNKAQENQEEAQQWEHL